MKKLWKESLDKITPYTPGKPIEEVRRELGLEDIIKLASNENPLGPSPRVIQAIDKAAKQVNRYPDGSCFYLRKVLCKKLSVAGGNIVFGNGSDEIIVLALRAFVNPGEEVVIAEPTFLIYKIASLVEGAKVRTVPMKAFRYDMKAMSEAITDRTKMVFVANPDNPTGSYVTKDELDEFIRTVPKDVIIFLDEAYYEFAKGGDYPETLELVNRKDRNVILTRSFSKAYGLAGLRIGYCLAREDIAKALEKVREPFNVNSLAQAAAMAALEDKEYLKTSLSLVAEEKKKFYALFGEMNIKYIPSRTNFVLVDTGRDSKRISDHLLKRGVIVREMSPWGLNGFIRVTIGLKEENDKFFEVFKNAMKNA